MGSEALVAVVAFGVLGAPPVSVGSVSTSEGSFNLCGNPGFRSFAFDGLYWDVFLS